MDAMLVQMSVSASLIIAAALCIRALALYSLPKRVFQLLWGIAAVRLLLPFRVPCRFSFYTVLSLLEAPGTQTMAGEAAGISALWRPPGIQAIEMEAYAKYYGAPLSAAEWVWILGVLSCAAFFLAAYIRGRKRFASSMPVEQEMAALQPVPLRRQVQIRQTDRAATPLTYGIFRPVILFPMGTDWADQKNRHALIHEYMHIKHWDALAKLVLAAAACVHWFNPLVWLMYCMANRDMELACDEAALKILGADAKGAYALTLIAFEEAKGQRFPIASHFSKSAAEERVKAIMKTRAPSKWAAIAGILIVLILTISFATSAMDPNEAILKAQTGASGRELRYLRSIFADFGIQAASISPSDNPITQGMDETCSAAFDVQSTEGREYLLLLRREDQSFRALLDHENKVLYGLVDTATFPQYFN